MTAPKTVADRVVAAAEVCTDAEVACAIRVLAANELTQKSPDTFLLLLVGWLESAVRRGAA